MIDKFTIDKIFDAIDIVEVISDFVSLKKSGQNYKGLSPWTNEKTPSFFVSPSKGIFKDFSSGKGGNAISFLMEHEKLSYPEALRYLAKKYNIEIIDKEPSPEDIRQKNVHESLQVINSFAQKYFTEILHNHTEGRSVGLSYFRERGFHDHILKKFQLGYSLNQRDAFTREAIKNGYQAEYLITTGLTIQKDDHRFDRFHGRIIFPIHGLSGNVLGFGGRILKTEEKLAKYINSPESEIYSKSKILYGLYFARQSIVKQEKCYLVEGYTDVLALHQAGIENVVASSGTSLTVEQIRLIKRFTPNITIIYDGDEAGIAASIRGIDLVLEEGLNVRVVLLPEGEDPDSWSRKMNANGFNEYINSNEQDFISFKVQLLLKEARKDPVKRAGLINDVIRSISIIPDTITRAVYIKECSKLLDTEEKILYSQVYRIRRKKAEERYSKVTRQEEVSFQSAPIPSFVKEIYCESQEKLLIRFLLQYGNENLFEIMEKQMGNVEYISVAEYIINEILDDELEFRNLIYRKIFEEVLSYIKQGEVIDLKYFTNHPDGNISRVVADLLSTPYVLSKVHKRKGALVETEEMMLKKTVPKAIVEYKRKILEIAQKEKQNEIKTAQEDNKSGEEINHFMQQYMAISSLINTISKERGWVVLK
jgi:DNA primase